MKGVTILLGLAATLASSHALSNGLRGSNNAMRVGVAPVPGEWAISLCGVLV